MKTPWIRVAGIICIYAVCLLMAGCATTDGDIPWNSPQPWEGAPSIPGMNMQ